jgi:cytochrome P450
MSQRAEIDFDHQSDAYFADEHAAWAEARKCPVAHSPRHGGFWLVSGYDEVAAVARDEATFSSAYPVEWDSIDYIGIMGLPRPPGLSPAGIAESEEGIHVELRRLLNPYMLPPAVARHQPFLDQLTTWVLDQHIARGGMDMVNEFISAIPAIVTLRLIGLPCDRWEHYRDVFHNFMAFGEGTPEYNEAAALVPGMMEDLQEKGEERRRDPRDDMLSALATFEFEGERLTDDQFVSILWNLVAGGLDTTTSFTALTLCHLAKHPELRTRLIEDPELLVSATEEYLRYTSISETLTRTVTKDVELGGQQLRRGDLMMISWLSANLDDRVFADPEEIVLDRSPNPHLAFGIGSRRCIGLHLARAQFKTMVREVLTRIPDYTVDSEGTAFYERTPLLGGVVRMPVQFTPGVPTGVARPF